MKRAIYMLALLVAIAFAFAPNHADAGATVWMEFVDGTGNDLQVLQNGAPGSRLILTDEGGGIINITVNLMANISDDQGNLASMSTNLVTSSSDIRVTAATSNLPGPTAAAGANQIEGFGPGNILTAYGMGDFFFGLPTGDNQLLGTISFFIDWGNNQTDFDISVGGTIGATTWATLAGTAVDPVVFGDGLGTNGAVINSFGGTLFTIVDIPEPSSISLLGVGTLALIRRRRS